MSKKMFIVFDENSGGLSLGCHCEDCLSKGRQNAEILGQKLLIRPDTGDHRCVFCGHEN